MSETLNLETARAYAAENGVELTPDLYAEITALQTAERDRLAALAVGTAQQQPGRLAAFVDAFNRIYPRFLETLHGVGEVLLTLLQTVIVAFGVPITLGLLLVVEHGRVVHGIELFEASASFASFAAWALVILNLVLEFVIHFIEMRAGYLHERARRWSLRLWLAGMAYTIGWGDDWQPREQSPAAAYKRVLRVVTFAILALALTGSMRSALATAPGAWHEAIVDILTRSSLLEMLTWAGGLLFAFAADLSAQALSRYVAIRCAEILARLATATADAGAHEDVARLDEVAAAHIIAHVNTELEKRRAKAEAKAARPTRPARAGASGNTAPDLDVPVSTPMNGHVNGLGGGDTAPN